MDSPKNGSQVLTRVVALMRLISKASPVGLSTSQLAVQCSLARSTTHRLLTALAQAGYLDIAPETKKWVLGPEIYLMGMLAAKRYDISSIVKPHLENLSKITGESAFLSARRGWESICLLREEGSFPVRSFVLHEGIRFPLGVASAGLAMLSFLDANAINDYLNSIDFNSENWPNLHSRAELESRIKLTKQRGYAVNPGLLVEGSWGIGAAVFDENDQPAWALSFTGIESRFKPERQIHLGGLLVDAAHQITKELKLRAESHLSG